MKFSYMFDYFITFNFEIILYIHRYKCLLNYVIFSFHFYLYLDSVFKQRV